MKSIFGLIISATFLNLACGNAHKKSGNPSETETVKPSLSEEKEPEKTENSDVITHEFQVESFSEGKIFPGSYFVDNFGSLINTEHRLEIGVPESYQNTELKGYALTLIEEIRETVNGHPLPWFSTIFWKGKEQEHANVLFIRSEKERLKSIDDILELSGQEIFLKSEEEEEVAVGKLIVNDERSKGSTFDYTNTILCEKEYAQVCSISFSQTISKSERHVLGGILVHKVDGNAKLTIINSKKVITWQK
jgi:hypothetical protein